MFRLVFFLLVLAGSGAQGQLLKRVHDFNPNGGSYTHEVIPFGTSFITITDDSLNGTELWLADLNLQTANIIKDINPGSGGSDPFVLGLINGKMVFYALDSTGYRNLWATDGTFGGTVKIADITQLSFLIEEYGVTDSLIFFIAADSVHGAELWVSDGTSVGTHLTKDINPGSDPMVGAVDFAIQALGNQVVFAANDSIHQTELWISDGSTLGTYLLADLDTSNAWPNAIPQLVKINNRVYGLYHGISEGIFISDGTIAGTKMVKAVYDCAEIQNFQNKLLLRTVAFGGPAQNYINSLSFLDTLIPGINPFYTFQGNYLNLYGFIGDSAFYFVVATNTSGTWMGSNGTALGTYPLFSDFIYLWNTLVFNNKLFLGKLVDSAAGFELHALDALNNNVQTMNIFQGPQSSFPHHLTPLNDKLFFIARDSIKGYQLFYTNGYSNQVNMLLPFQSCNNNALEAIGPGKLPAAGHFLFVNANYDSVGTELYYLDTQTALDVQGPETFGVEAVVFPNPSETGLFHIKSRNDLTGYEVYNTKGVKLASGVTAKVDLSAFPDGLYILRCLFHDQVGVTRILKRR